MIDLLESPDDINVNSANKFDDILSASWYAEFDMVGTKSGLGVFSNCRDFLADATPETRTKKESEYNAYLEFKVMCTATDILSNAVSPKVSYLPPNILNKNTPEVWPKDVAIQTSTSEWEKIKNNKDIINWNDVTKITEYEIFSNYEATYSNRDLTQELKIIGVSDFNEDGNEDIMLVSRDSITDSNYFNLRLFLLTANKNGSWKIIWEI